MKEENKIKKAYHDNLILIITIGILTLIILLLIGLFSVIKFPIMNDNDSCPICEYNWYESEILKHNDPGYGHIRVFQNLWDEANLGKQLDIQWMEKLRYKYDLTDSVPSFLTINYSNIRPSSPYLKYRDYGFIQELKPEQNVGYSHLIELYIQINNVTYYWGVFENWDSSQVNLSHPYFVFQFKDRAWSWSMHDARIIDAFLEPSYADNINASWAEYYKNYDVYLSRGGVDLGDGYWM